MLRLFNPEYGHTALRVGKHVVVNFYARFGARCAKDLVYMHRCRCRPPRKCGLPLRARAYGRARVSRCLLPRVLARSLDLASRRVSFALPRSLCFFVAGEPSQRLGLLSLFCLGRCFLFFTCVSVCLGACASLLRVYVVLACFFSSLVSSLCSPSSFVLFLRVSTSELFCVYFVCAFSASLENH